MTTLTGAQVYQLAVGAGLSPPAAVIATAIAKAESGWNPDAVGDVNLENGTWGPSVGLWQIRSKKAAQGTGQDRDMTRLTDPIFNAQAMADISGMGTNFSAWTTYTTGAYKAYTSQAAAAAGQATAAGVASGVQAAAGTTGGGVENASLGSAISGALGLPDWLALAYKGIGVLAGAVLVILGVNRLSASNGGPDMIRAARQTGQKAAETAAVGAAA